MECSEFKKYLPDLVNYKLDSTLSEDCLDHLEKCPSCHNELEIHLIINYGMDNEKTSSEPFVLDKVYNEFIRRMDERIKKAERIRTILHGLKIVSYVIIFLGIIFGMGYIL